MTTWLVVLGVGAGSYLLRLVPLLVVGRIGTGPRFERAIRHAGTAALAALLATALHDGAGAGHGSALVLAAAVGLVVAARDRSMVTVVVSGVATYATSVALSGLLA